MTNMDKIIIDQTIKAAKELAVLKLLKQQKKKLKLAAIESYVA